MSLAEIVNSMERRGRLNPEDFPEVIAALRRVMELDSTITVEVLDEGTQGELDVAPRCGVL